MKRFVPAPVLSLALWALWLLLNETLAAGHVLLGLAVGLAVPWLMAPLRPAGPRIRKPLVLARLVLRVGADVVLSALDVGWSILRSHRRPPDAHFVVIPLDLRDAHALAALAVITTVVPGTVWSELAPDRHALLLHVLEVGDEASFVQHFKTRYEQPLKDIFE